MKALKTERCSYRARPSFLLPLANSTDNDSITSSFNEASPEL